MQHISCFEVNLNSFLTMHCEFYILKPFQMLYNVFTYLQCFSKMVQIGRSQVLLFYADKRKCSRHGTGAGENVIPLLSPLNWKNLSFIHS